MAEKMGRGSVKYDEGVYILLFFIVFVSSNEISADWNGCFNRSLLAGENICYEILHPMSGDEAWKKCLNSRLSDNDTSVLGETIRKLMGDGPSTIELVWMGAIESYAGSGVYEYYDGTKRRLEERAVRGSRGCLALNVFSSRESSFVRRNCQEEHNMLCLRHLAAEAYAYNGSAPDACSNYKALSLMPLGGCYVQEDGGCEFLYSVLIHPVIGNKSLHNIARTDNISVIVTEIRTQNTTFAKSERTNSTRLCGVPDSDNYILLQLRRNRCLKRLSSGVLGCICGDCDNKTAGNLVLWVRSPGRAQWPPKCVGAEVDTEGDPEALRIILTRRSEVVWCYTRDIINGDIAVSNSIILADDETSDSCSDGKNMKGPPASAKIDYKASCLRCLEQAIAGDEENRTCTEIQCGPHGLNFSVWNRSRFSNGSLEEFKECAQNRQCAGDVLWELTEGEDCNGDGIVDCDDRFIRRFMIDCKTSKPSKPRLQYFAKWVNYWNCRTDAKADFVDLPTEIGIARYFCLKTVAGRYWSDPEIISENASYYISTTTRSPMVIEKETTEALYTLKVEYTGKNINLTKAKTKEIIESISKMFDLDESVLRNAQRDSDVSSLPELLETILLRVPSNINFTTPNLAVSKKIAIGFQLISDNPSEAYETFGRNRKQIPISSREDINRKQVEAAVFLPNIDQETTLVLVTFAKGSDFTRCKGPATKGVITTNYSTSLSDRYPIEAAHLPEETEETEELSEATDQTDAKSRQDCPTSKELVRGCFNSHVVQVGLMSKNGSYMHLPQGKWVDLLLRTKSTPMMSQTKKCVYWKPRDGGWSTDGCELLEGTDGLDTCRCTHLTHFAQLVSEGDAVTGPHKEWLNRLSSCACILSLLGLSGVILAGIFAKKWRSKWENKVMLNLAVAMSLYTAIFLWATLQPNRPDLVGRCPMHTKKLSILCQVTGAILHYFVLSTFCWMLVAAVAHYIRFTTLTGPSSITHFVLKFSLVGWGSPLLPVIVLIVVDPDTYAGTGRDFCYPTGTAFYVAVLAPILIVLLINMVLFLLILRRLFPRCCEKEGEDLLRRFGNEERENIRKAIVCVAFSFLFGLTWYFGLLCFTVVPAYIFCVVAALQGPSLLVFFVLGEESIRTKLKGLMKRRGREYTEQTSERDWSGSTNSTNVLAESSQSKTRWKQRGVAFPKTTKTYIVNGVNTHPNRQVNTLF